MNFYHHPYSLMLPNQLHVSQHPTYEREEFFTAASMPSTSGWPGPVILTTTPVTHVCHAAAPPLYEADYIVASNNTHKPGK